MGIVSVEYVVLMVGQANLRCLLEEGVVSSEN